MGVPNLSVISLIQPRNQGGQRRSRSSTDSIYLAKTQRPPRSCEPRQGCLSLPVLQEGHDAGLLRRPAGDAQIDPFERLREVARTTRQLGNSILEECFDIGAPVRIAESGGNERQFRREV